ncbi:MAG TPA: PD-(D/E)XK nuclease family protein, partial [Halanaerobiales bacterium]|nr:PD-(D/E)XK nuclease family protein [Halanaerobiales bacterium]
KDLKKFISNIEKARKLKDVKNPYILIKELIGSCNYREALKADHKYKQQWANLNKVLYQIKELYQKRNCSLKEVLDFYQKNRENETREGQAELKSKAGSVQLMSVHQAKGLEFPVVIIPDIQRGLIHHNTMPDILIDQEKGIGIKISTNEFNLGTPLYNELKEEEKELELYEKIRLLYVAMTRAEDKLILSGYTKNNRKLNFADSKSWLDWLAAYLGKESFDNSEEICFNYDNEDLKLTINIIKDRAFKTEPKLAGKEPNQEIEINNWDSLKQWESISDKIKPVDIESQEYKAEISVTGLMEYERCPRLYYLRHLKRIPDLKALKAQNNEFDYKNNYMDPLKKGLIIHRLYELSGLEKDPGHYMKQVLTEMNYQEIEKQAQEDLIEVLTNYQKREKSYLKQKSELINDFHEKQFTLNFANFYLKGTIDNIYLYQNDEIEIIDFKTNNIKADEVQETSEDYRLQLEAYSLAVSQLFNKSKIKYRIEYLIPEVNYSKVLKTDDLLSIENKILSTGNQIAVSNNKEDFKIKKNSDCKYCIYGRICEKGK